MVEYPMRSNDNRAADPLDRPPPYMAPYDCFVRHYLYWQAKRRAGGQPRDRPELGQLMQSTGFSKSTCRRFRKMHEATLPAQARAA